MQYESFLDRRYLKDLAKQQIKGKIGVLFVISLIIALISAAANGLLGIIPVAGPIASSIVITPAFSLSLCCIYLNLVRGIAPQVKDVFCGFGDFWSAFKTQFLVGLFTFLWSLLLIVPGIIKSFSYSLSMYIQAENPGKPALECIAESKAIMEGHKAELFMLCLSFLGWILLGVITFGIAYIYVLPFYSATIANFYENVKPKTAGNAGPEF